jgi:23S rRNA (guanosine2251-2'-O)-methyltransferase
VKALGGEQVEGRNAVRELLRAGTRRVRDVWLSVDDAEIESLAAAARVAIRRVSRTELDREARSEAPQGVLAHAAPLAEVPLEALCTTAAFLVVLDGVTDPQNVGALLRTAAVAGATGVVLPRHRAAHVTPTVAKAAAGAIEYLPISVVAGIPSAMQVLAERGVWTVGLDAGAAHSVWDLEVATAAVALVLGAEGSGLSRLVRNRCDLVVSIPQRSPLDSLNVSAAGAVAMFEVARRRQH